VLCEIEVVLGSFDVDAKEEAERARVPNSKLRAELIDDGAKKSSAGTGEHYVINIKEKIGDVGATMEDEKR
jgi:hypothetical protein